jgi:hypothetical protein
MRSLLGFTMVVCVAKVVCDAHEAVHYCQAPSVQ